MNQTPTGYAGPHTLEAAEEDVLVPIQQRVKKKEVSNLDGIKIEDIFNPKPYLYSYLGANIPIAPMQDKALMEVSEDLDAVVELVLESVTYDEKGGIELTGMLSSLPKIFKTAYPKIARILAQSLGKSEEEIARVPLAHKIGLFQGVLEAENIPLLLKNAAGLSSLLPETPAQPLIAEASPTETASS